MKTCHNMNIIVQNTGGYASSINGKIGSYNKTLANITIALLLNSIHKKELWCFAYRYAIWLSCRTENRFHGDILYLLWCETWPSYKISKYGVWESISSMNVLQEIILIIGFCFCFLKVIVYFYSSVCLLCKHQGKTGVPYPTLVLPGKAQCATCCLYAFLVVASVPSVALESYF